MLKQSSPHGGPSHPLKRKTRLKVIVIGVIVVGVSVVLPPDTVSALAQVAGSSATVATVLQRRKEAGQLAS